MAQKKSKKIEKKLPESEKFYATLIQNIKDGVVVIDFKGKILFANQAAARIAGLKSSQKWVGSNILKFIAPEFRKNVIKDNLLVKKGKGGFLAEYKIITVKGKDVWVEAIGKKIAYQQKNVNLVVIRDITDKKRAEQEVRELTKLNQDIIDKSPLGIFIIDKNSIVEYANESFAQTSGSPIERLRGINVLTLPTYKILGLDKKIQQAIKNKKGFTTDIIRYKSYYGKKETYRIFSGIPILDADGNLDKFLLTIDDVTKIKKAELALRESEARFKQVTENVGECVWEVDANAVYTYASPVVEKMLGYKPEELVGKKHFYDLFTPETREELKKTAFEIFAKKENFIKFVNPNVHKNGNIVILETSGSPVLDEEGNLLGYRGSDTDVTELKKAEEALKKSEEKYKTTFENTGTAVIIIEEDTIISLANYQFELLVGYSRQEIENKMSWTKFIYKEDLEKMKKYHKARREQKNKVPKEYEFRLIDKKGNIKNIFITIDVIPGTKKSIASLIDITERKKAEEELKKSEEKFRTVADYAYDWEYWINPKGKIIYISPSCERITGYSVNEFSQNPKLLTDIVHPDDVAIVKNHKHKISETGEIKPIEFRIISKNKEERWIGHVCQVVYNNNGLNIGIRGSNRDITDRKRAEEELKESEEKYSTVVKNSKDGIIIQRKGIIEYVNYAAEKLTGYTNDESIGKNMMEFIAPEYRELVNKRYMARAAGKDVPSIYEIALIKKDSSIIPVEINNSIITYKGNPSALVFLRDLTERKRGEKKLKESKEKLSQIVQGNPIATFVIDKNHIITHWNKACEKLTGVSKDKMIGTKDQWKPFYSKKRPVMADLIIVDDRLNELDKYYEGKWRESTLLKNTYEVEDFFPNLNNRPTWIFFTATPIKLEGNIIGAIETMQDITKRKKIEEGIKEKIAELEKMNKLMVGRELKMTELKEEIKELEKKKN